MKKTTKNSSKSKKKTIKKQKSKKSTKNTSITTAQKKNALKTKPITKRPQKNGLSFVKNLKDLKELLNEGYYEYRIALSGGIIFSRKYIYYNPKKKKPFHITNCIDDSTQDLTEKELMSKKWTNIGEAIKKNCLIVDLKEKIN
jgi:hypothetical protein